MTVMIGIAPHKRSHTAAPLDEHAQILDKIRIDATRRQVKEVWKFARRWPERTWAVENVNGLGRLLSRQLVDADQTVVDVPAKLAVRVRTVSSAGHKTDAHDARSAAVAGRHATTVLRPVVADGVPELFVAIVGDVYRFPTAEHFASFTGTAPIAASSGDVIRYRLNRGGHRQLNKVLHTAAKVQAA